MNLKGSLLPLCCVTASLALAANGYAQSVPTNGLVLYYPFNGNAQDASGNGNNGTVQGATLTTNRFGVPESAFHFNGTSSAILVPNYVFGPTVTGATVSVWITTDDQSYTNQLVIYVKSPVDGGMAMGTLPPGVFSFGAELPPNVWYTANATNPILPSTVTHVVGVYQMGQNASLYLNGVLVAQTSPLPDTNLFTQSFTVTSALGAFEEGGVYQFFHGNMEDFRIYNRALSGSEVQQLYAYESTHPSCLPYRAAATATVTGGQVTGATVTDSGCGYTNTPLVLVLGGGGNGSTATATVTNGFVTGITITNPGSGYTSTPDIYIYSPIGLQVGLLQAVVPSFFDLLIGTNYQLQASSNLINWTNQGSVFTATNPTSQYPGYFLLNSGNQLYFRAQQVP